VRVTGVTAFSPFVLNQNVPTAIELVSFSGTSRSGNIILATALAIALAMLGLVLWLRRRQNAG
jgi:MYXO-CTERM domain-containing protein